MLTHWGRVMHICVNKQTIIGSDNGLSPDRCQAIIWTNAGLLLIGHLETNFSEILIEILTFSFRKMRLKVSSAKRRPFCLGLNVLKSITHYHINSSNGWLRSTNYSSDRILIDSFINECHLVDWLWQFRIWIYGRLSHKCNATKLV